MIHPPTRQQIDCLFTPLLAPYIELRAFRRGPGGRPGGGADQHFILARKPDWDAAAGWLADHDRRGFEIYVGANPRLRQSGKKSDVQVYSACFCDLDGFTGSLPPLPIAPTLIVHSGGGTHVYFCTDTQDRGAWEAAQRGLYEAFRELGADRAVVTDEARVLRLVPFPNRKGVLPITTRIIACNPGARYAIETIRAAFPYTPPAPPAPRVGPRQQAQRRGGLSAADRCVAYLRRLPDAISGQGGHNRTLRAAAECWRFGLSREEAEGVMVFWNGEKCRPEWTAREIAHKLSDAEKMVRALQQFGCRLREGRR